MGRSIYPKTPEPTFINGFPYQRLCVKKHTLFPRNLRVSHPLQVTCIEHALSLARDCHLLTMGTIRVPMDLRTSI